MRCSQALQNKIQLNLKKDRTMTMPVTPIAKHGACPAGWHADGHYGVANPFHPQNAIPKNRPCPAGYHGQENDCVQN